MQTYLSLILKLMNNKLLVWSFSDTITRNKIRNKNSVLQFWM